MKIFIAGARSVQKLDTAVKQRLMTIYKKGYDVLVGDCYGIDTSVQKFYHDLGYKNVTVFASNGKARNNIGGRNIHSVPVPSYVRGFDLYKQKDIAMADEADYGFMIWDGVSRGTLNNTVNLITRHKSVLMYLTSAERMFVIKTSDDLSKIIDGCMPKTQITYFELLRRNVSV